MNSIQQSTHRLHQVLREYIEARYHISALPLIRQRRALLNKPGVIHRVPYIESTPRYRSGSRFEDLESLNGAALEIFQSIDHSEGDLKQLIFNPPFEHQLDSVRSTLIEGKNIIVTTGTGSGKTECFLLPILGRFAIEAKASSDEFGHHSAMRALVLYPMNALVNDQLGRLRGLFGDPRVVSLFREWTGRPARFARYTSRTPYAGVRDKAKDQRKIRAFETFYVQLERDQQHENENIAASAKSTIGELKKHGRWPAKPSMRKWYGEPKARWTDADGQYIRAVTLPDDVELVTRHEIQENPPDLLVTNYSMLEYMLMRPIERVIFDRTREWLEQNPREKFLIVLDEAHLYRGAAGAEVGLLMRRLRARLGVAADRLQVICATASFSNVENAPEFAAQLSGIGVSTFDSIQGTLERKRDASTGNSHDVEVLASIDLNKFYESEDDTSRMEAIRPLLEYRGIAGGFDPVQALHQALADYPPMGQVINMTMSNATSVESIGTKVFPDAGGDNAAKAATVLLNLGCAAKEDRNRGGLLSCRVHCLFRGIPGLWVCMDPGCNAVVDETHRSDVCGKMYAQPRNRCSCGGLVLELYTCTCCGTAYGRAYVDNVESFDHIWSEPGISMRTDENESRELQPLELLLETPPDEDDVEPIDLDVVSGRVDSPTLGPRTRRLHVKRDRRIKKESNPSNSDISLLTNKQGEFGSCVICGEGTLRRDGRSVVQDHQTKGDQPFQALVAEQIRLQPPANQNISSFAPLQGRKSLVFSDSRQVAARLAPNLQRYSVRDSLRPLIIRGYERLQNIGEIRRLINLNDLYFAVLLEAIISKVRLHSAVDYGSSLVSGITALVNKGEHEDPTEISEVWQEFRGEIPPSAVMDDLLITLQDRLAGLEALALASIVEREKHIKDIEKLPDIIGVAENSDAKVALVRAWLRCWRGHGVWLQGMHTNAWLRPRARGMSVRGRARMVKIKAMQSIIVDSNELKKFNDKWSPVLYDRFTESASTSSGEPLHRLVGRELSLQFGGTWVTCSRCKSVHRPIPAFDNCLDCGHATTRSLIPDEDIVFQTRSTFYRRPTTDALKSNGTAPLNIIAAEHTAQLNAPQHEDVFSQAEKNELRFQDIRLHMTAGGNTAENCAIDVLSSTTTMEVGIDIGSLTGVALRNMPPARANYQQRAGRAGRRGNSMASIIAFGSVDSHDDHYFSRPEEMVRGAVVDPVLTLDNVDIIRRHVRAYLLQEYHRQKIPGQSDGLGADLFSVLGTVEDFRDHTAIINFANFQHWLRQNREVLQKRIQQWLPTQLTTAVRGEILENMHDDCVAEIGKAIGLEALSRKVETDAGDESQPQEGDEVQQTKISQDKLLDRLLYCGVLPRYAFPTDVASFYVFDGERSTPGHPVMEFAPSQSLAVALTQYAPGKLVWISGQCYMSGAVYSIFAKERMSAWEEDRCMYLECKTCEFAETRDLEGGTAIGSVETCPACGDANTFGPARVWMRPPNFAHPVDIEPVSVPDDIPEPNYATRAKLALQSPRSERKWTKINDRSRIIGLREHLLVSNTGAGKQGYEYCTRCGRVRSMASNSESLKNRHATPYPSNARGKNCSGDSVVEHIVLGSRFITDIALMSIGVDDRLTLKPGLRATYIAMRTLSEALAKSACRILEIQPTEIMAEFRPALTTAGKEGAEAEIFLYDTLPGGAGFCRRLVDMGDKLLDAAQEILTECSEGCDASCYRCLRNFGNRFEHRHLDRHVAANLLGYIRTGVVEPFDRARMDCSTTVLCDDIRIRRSDLTVEDAPAIEIDGRVHQCPIVIRNDGGKKVTIIVENPLFAQDQSMNNGGIVFQSELAIRHNMQAVTKGVLELFGE